MVSGMSAPLDQYFGRYDQSVLEIRNRLAVFDEKSDLEIARPDGVGAIDNVEDAVIDWQQKYPGDPWVVSAMADVLDDYARAGVPTDPHAEAILGIMLASYPRAPQTGEALLAVVDAATGDDETPVQPPSGSAATVSGEVVDASTGAPVAGAVVIVAPDRESSDLGSSAFATTAADGSFAVLNVPLGATLTAGPVTLAHAEFIVVEPPRGSAYAPYHGVIDAGDGKAQAGIIRLAAGAR